MRWDYAVEGLAFGVILASESTGRARRQVDNSGLFPAEKSTDIAD